ncbi:helix-turn-helix domain-containing protein [Sphingobium tyrosinilyticum]|uniref:Helix-turn-helix domain-containing protein n=1 Tax=Sphingobium tyrosinilyticum TaxID=2715436 RepID=A0ABV9EYP8_9SPHN
MAEDFDPTIPRPFSVNGLAEHWSCSPSMVRKLIDQGSLGHFRLGILIRIPVAAVEEFERANTLGGPTPLDTGEEALPDSPMIENAPRNIPRARRSRPPFKRPDKKT